MYSRQAVELIDKDTVLPPGFEEFLKKSNEGLLRHRALRHTVTGW